MLINSPPPLVLPATEKFYYQDHQHASTLSASADREKLQCLLNSLQATHPQEQVAEVTNGAAAKIPEKTPENETAPAAAKSLTFNDVPAACINYAAAQYKVPPVLILSLLKTENGHEGTARRNTNGSIDYGPAQINSRWLPMLKSYGIDRQSLQYDPCVNVDVGTWILAQELAKTPDFTQAVGNYNSHTPIYNQRYAFKVLHWQHYFQQGLVG